MSNSQAAQGGQTGTALSTLRRRQPNMLLVRLDDLQIPHLSQLKKQLDEEIQHLTSSFQQLRAAQSKFRDCLKSLSAGLASKNANRTILVPLTASLYVPGKLDDTEKVLVDVGTGFFVEKDKKEAKEFYDGKVADLGSNLADLEKIVTGKTENLRMVEDGKLNAHGCPGDADTDKNSSFTTKDTTGE
jgi:prefoldin alpha subunit